MPAPPPHLFHPDTAGSYRRAMGAAVDHLVDHLASTAGRPLTGATPREAAERVAAVDLDHPLGEGAAVRRDVARPAPSPAHFRAGRHRGRAGSQGS